MARPSPVPSSFDSARSKRSKIRCWSAGSIPGPSSATVTDDVPGVRCRDLIGVDKMMWGSDYPHFDSTFPKSREAIARNLTGVPEDEQELILAGNMVRVYNLQEILA